MSKNATTNDNNASARMFGMAEAAVPWVSFAASALGDLLYDQEDEASNMNADSPDTVSHQLKYQTLKEISVPKQKLEANPVSSPCTHHSPVRSKAAFDNDGHVSTHRDPDTLTGDLPTLADDQGGSIGEANLNTDGNIGDVGCNLNKIDNTVCHCAGNTDRKIIFDLTCDIGPEAKDRSKDKVKGLHVSPSRASDGSSSSGFSSVMGVGYNHGWDGDCPQGESPWLWYRDAVWGCEEFLFDVQLERKRYAKYVADMAAKFRAKKTPDGKVTYSQGGQDHLEVTGLKVFKEGPNFKVTWGHPKGPHPFYLVVVYPPIGEGRRMSDKAPDCGPCAMDDECLCSTRPIHRRLYAGTVTQGFFPADLLKFNKTYVIEVVTLDQKKQESLGSSLVTFETSEKK